MAPAHESAYPTMCYGCRTTAVIRATFTDPGTGPAGRGEVVWCENCAQNAAPVLVYAGLVVTLSPVLRRRPDTCEREGCGRLAARGRPFCSDHLRDLVEVYAEPAQPAPEVESWHIAGDLRKLPLTQRPPVPGDPRKDPQGRRPGGVALPAAHEHQSFDGGSECLACLLDEDAAAATRR